jgi:hypothetical protein
MLLGTRRRRIATALIALAAVFAVTTAAVAVTLQKSGGPVKAVRVVTADDGTSIYGLTPENVAGMSVTVTVPSGEKALLLITFSAQTRCQHSLNEASACLIQVKVDDNIAKPGAVTFAHMEVFDSLDDIIDETHSMQFVAGPLNAGQHTVTVQGWVTKQYTYFGLTARTLSVLRSKV